MKVTADRVNLRAGASETTEVVGQVHSGQILIAMEEDGDWTRVVPPDGTEFWVYAELVDDGIVTVPKLHVRSGPGINYLIVGHVTRGDRIHALGVRGDWLKIEPPEGSSLWISSEFLTKIFQDPPRTEVTKPSAEQQETPGPVAHEAGRGSVTRQTVILPSPPRPTAPSTESHASRSGASPSPVVSDPVVTLPAALARYTLAESSRQGTRVEYIGIVVRSGLLWRHPASYRVEQYDENGRRSHACYVLGAEELLATCVGKRVRVSGRQYILEGVRWPVIDQQQITRLP